jgi:hypothetical protein
MVMGDASENPDVANPAAVQTDEQLMVAFSRGSTEAFSELFSRYFGPRRGTNHAPCSEHIFMLSDSRYWARIAGKPLFGPRS